MSTPIQQVVADEAPQLAALFIQYVEANKPALEAIVVKEGASAVTYIETAILAALPKNGLLATLFNSAAKSVVTQFATNIIAKLGSETDALIALAEMEVSTLAASLAAVKPPTP